MKIKVFSAAWCSQCEGMKQTLSNMGLEFDVIDIDSEEGSALAQQHRVRSLPTVIIDYKDTTTVVVGAKNKAFVKDLINELEG